MIFPGMKEFRIHPSAPQDQIFHTPLRKFSGQCLIGNHGGGCGAMKPAQKGISPVHRHGEARCHILRKTGMERGGKGEALAYAPDPRCQPQGSFGSNVNGFGNKTRKRFPHLTKRFQSQGNFRVGRAGHTGYIGSMNHQHIMAFPAQMHHCLLQGTHHPIDLWGPCIGN